MKKLLCLVFCWVPFVTFAQLVIEPNNFYWQRVVEYPGTKAEIYEAIVKAGIFTTIQKEDSSTIIGRVENVPLKYKSMEPRPQLFNKPVYFRDGEKFSGTLIYEIKKGRYRVTFKELTYNSDLTVLIGNVAADMNNLPVNDLFFKKNGQFVRGPQVEEFAYTVFDYSFSNAFIVLLPTDSEDDDW